MNNNVQNKEVAFCPSMGELFLMYIIVILLFILAVTAILDITDTIFSLFKNVNWIKFSADTIFVIFCSPIIFAVIDSETLFVNKAQRYFKIKDRIVKFDDISGFKYKYGYECFPHKSPFSVTFTLYLYSGENVTFDIYFFGYEKVVSDRLTKIGISKY